MQEIQSRTDVTVEQFHNYIVKEGQPVVLKGLTKDWPSVGRRSRSSEALSEYVIRMCNDHPVTVLVASGSEGGRFFYTEDLHIELMFFRKCIYIYI